MLYCSAINSMEFFIVCLLLFIPGVSATLTILSNDAKTFNLAREIGIARAGHSLNIVEVNTAIHCTIECSKLYGCKSFNFISHRDVLNGFSCELFCGLMKDKDKVQNENSIYYEFFISERDCVDVLDESYSHERNNGIHQLVPFDFQIITAVCDMKTSEGGWTLLQRRFDGSVDFYRGWESYKRGFGDLNGEFWLGLEIAHHLMKDTNTTLRFDLWNDTDHSYQEYYEAMISHEADKYRLSFKGTSGNAGDSLSARAKNRMFSTKDEENDEVNSYSCAKTYHGAWWYGDCHHANLNGKYGNRSVGVGLNWYTMTGFTSSLSRTEIKVKRHSIIGC